MQLSVKQLFTKYHFLTELPQISHIHKNNWNFLNQPLLPYNLHGSDMWVMYFFIFASCEPLRVDRNLILDITFKF